MHITQALHRGVQQHPDLAYSIFGPRVLTYREVRDRVARIAGGLRERGVGSGDRVAILGLNSDTYLQLLLGVPWADAVVVPVNFRWSVQEIAYSLNEAGVRVLCVDDTFAPVVPALREASPQLETVVHIGEQPAPDGTVSLNDLMSTGPIPDAERRGDALAGIFYTGGTTGFPKGVMLSHRNLLTSSMGYGATGTLPPDGKTMHVAPVFHLAALSTWISNSLLAATHVMLPTFDPVEVMATIQDQEVSSVLLVPTMIQMIVDHPRRAEYDLSSLALLAYGASPISESLIGRARKALPGCRLQQGYGMTELSPVATILFDAAHDDPVLRRSAGLAAPHALVKIVDPDGREVPRGVVGEIVCSGDHVMLGYWQKPEETGTALRDGWMHTGDGGYMDERGYVFVVDRIKDMIVTGGENVYSAEVENVIASHPSVAQVAVIGVPDDVWGERVHAVVVLVPGAELSLDDVAAHSRAAIAAYKCPRSLEIIEEFPISAAGKILKRSLRAERR